MEVLVKLAMHRPKLSRNQSESALLL